MRQLNEANGRGTPDVATSGSFSTVGKSSRQRRKSGDGLINLLTPRRKRPPVTGSYSVQGAVGRQAPRREAMSSSSFRRQNSHPTTPLAPPRASLLSPSHLSSPAVLSPCRERLPSPTLPTTPNSQLSEVSWSWEKITQNYELLQDGRCLLGWQTKEDLEAFLPIYMHCYLWDE